MAKNKSIFRLRGSLGEVNFYEQDGNSYARLHTSIDKQRIMSDKAFKRTRENMSEFGGSATIGKALRQGFSAVFSDMSDSRATARLTAVFREMLGKAGSGLRGQRPISVLPNKDVLSSFDFNVKESFDSMFTAGFSAAPNTGRNEVVLTIPDFNIDQFVKAPEGATHFRMVCAISSVSDYSYDLVARKYQPDFPEINGLGAVDRSGYIKLGGMVGSATVLTATLPGSPTMPTTGSALAAAIGIEFFQQVGTNYYLLAQHNAMRVLDVY